MSFDLKSVVLEILDNMKAINVQSLDVRPLTTIADHMVFATGTSNRHVQALSQSLVVKLKGTSRPPLGVEGTKEGEWVLIDLGDIIVHIMQAETRAFYQVEKLWQSESAHRMAVGTIG